jgi:hypothetical protein
MRLLSGDWKAKDITGGRRLQNPDCGITGSVIIGWRQQHGVETDHQYSLISLADGMIFMSGTREEVAAELNTAGYYIPVELLREPTK